MTLEHKIGQRLVGGFPSTTMSDAFINAVKEYKIGNVILFRENIESAPQLKKLCADIQELITKETGYPAFITIDQEGGVVTRLPESLANIPGAMAMAATGDEKNAYTAGKLTAEELRSLGVNFNLSPSLDVNSNPDNPIIGARSYSDNAQTVAKFGVQMIKGLVDGGVLASAKHFPGHGDTAVDSHLALPCVDKSEDELMKMELAPFLKAIEANVPAIMTTHIMFPQIEKEKIPATMSRTIMTDLLRGKMGFKGLIVSDCMEMSAIAKFFTTEKGVKSALHAGVDLVFVSHSEERLVNSAKLAKESVLSGEINEDELNKSVERILKYKEQFKIAEQIDTSFDMDKAIEICDDLRRKTITNVQIPSTEFVLGGKPLCLGCSAFNTGLVGNIVEDIRKTFAQLIAPKIGGVAMQTAVDPEDSEIEKVVNDAKNHTSIVMNTYNGHLHPQQMLLMQKLAQTGIPMAVIALRNPYDLRNLPKHVWAIAAYEYTTPIVSAVADVLNGKLQPSGKLPITL